MFRISSLKEVSRRHESDLDRAHDDMFVSRGEINKYEESLPKTATNHRYYQDLRGYVTDLVECYDEKVGDQNFSFYISGKNHISMYITCFINYNQPCYINAYYLLNEILVMRQQYSK